MNTKTYGTLLFNSDKKRWAITKAEPHICIKLKAVFSGLGISRTMPFHFSDLPQTCFDLLWFTERYPLDISEKDLARLKKGKKQYQNNINELERILLPDYVPGTLTLNAGEEPRNYQLTGNDVYMRCKRLLLGDDLGLGKTLTAILSFLAPSGTLPAAVVAQTHLPKQWQGQIERFTNLRIHHIKGTKPYTLPPADVYIFKYSCLAGWTNFFQTGFFKSVVFDEAQELRRSESEKYKGAQALSKYANFCIGLTATPIYNYGIEIYNVLDCINKGCLGTLEDFTREWCGGRLRLIVQNPEALGTYLRSNFLMLRRTRKEVGRELPPVNTFIHTVAFDYEEYEKSEALAIQLAMTTLTGSFMERGSAAQQLSIRLRHDTGVAKARGVAEYVKILLENKEPVLLVGWHRAVYDIWKECFAEYKPVFFTGEESPAEKERTVKAFVSGETNLMIISVRSGIGLDGLQHRAKTVVFGELDWSPKVHEQVIARLDRDGQQDQVTCIYLVCDGGSDPPIIDMLGLKASQAHNIIDPLTAVPDQHTDEKRMKVFAQKFLEARGIALPEEKPEPTEIQTQIPL